MFASCVFFNKAYSSVKGLFKCHQIYIFVLVKGLFILKDTTVKKEVASFRLFSSIFNKAYSFI